MNTEQEIVIFLHGITRGKVDMLPLFLYFQNKGYKGINVEYPSTSMTLEDLADYVGKEIRSDKNYNPFATMHFITHSMGGLITRYFLNQHRPPHLGKVVMLGTPNTGSEFADFLHDHEIFGDLYKAFFGPAGAQLTTTYEHIDSTIDIDYPLGIIAGTSNVNPLAPWLFGADSDGVVAIERTKIKGMSDHIIMPVAHPFMMLNPDIMRQSHHFLEHGKFDKDADGNPT